MRKAPWSQPRYVADDIVVSKKEKKCSRRFGRSEGAKAFAKHGDGGLYESMNEVQAIVVNIHIAGILNKHWKDDHEPCVALPHPQAAHASATRVTLGPYAWVAEPCNAANLVGPASRVVGTSYSSR